MTGVGFKLDNTSNVLTLTITWDRPSSELPITHYFVRIAETQRQLRVDGATTLTIPATRGSAYTFSVIAVSAVGFGEWSESVTAERKYNIQKSVSYLARYICRQFTVTVMIKSTLPRMIFVQ